MIPTTSYGHLASLFVVFIVPVSPLATACGYPGYCVRQGLSHVPTPLDPRITDLRLSFNAISRIEKDDFAGLSQVVHLVLTFNDIIYVDDEAFTPCVSLLWLLLSGTKLVILPDLRSFPMLTKLWVDNTNLVYLPWDFFIRLESLYLLRIHSTLLLKLPNIKPNSTLGLLEMHRIPLATIPDLSTLPSLSVFTIDSGPIECDWRLCWVLFEPFDFTNREPAINSNGNVFASAHDLPQMVCHHLTARVGLVLMAMSPLELQCYYSRYSCSLIHIEQYSVNLALKSRIITMVCSLYL